ncbi:TonB-dependent receptor [Novosphingobium album (ex Liu et al. 2023)]|uniref:TonB-dependent receptor n=1 Tax=Novosphingobium album (ex Liu et al. 2023) TaxID=3031130 RepID=A0ABT5WN66_9SPHN|nr:TonB-dependent receptor [Novosphingobium album (ex Liu et al. 2023)]MDE8651490.1 TonB-dependent receptor [Novosphingobium album (ex Liu et al. 2023)]
MKTIILHGARTRRALHSTAGLLALIAGTPALAAGEAGAGGAATAPASAADDAADAYAGEAIVVTARHREEKSQDVPVAISVVDSGTLERTGNFTLNQIQQLVPSLQVSATNPRNSNINIRGLGANSALAVDGLEYGVGFYIDGVYYGRPGQSQFDLVDLQQIEVLRGPQGTLFGKNTTAGALNITSREPSFEPELTAEASLGNFDYHQVRASASAPILDDKIAVRLSVADTHRGGYLLNRYDLSRAQDYDNFTIRGQVLIKPAEDLKIRLIGDYSKQKQHFSLSLVDGYFTTFANGAPIVNNIFDRAARLNYTLPAPDAFQRVGNADAPFQANMESYGVSGQADWDIGPATLTSITAYRWWDWYPANDVDGTSLSINIKGQQINYQRQFSQELRIASNGTNKIDYVAGLFYFWQIIRGYGATQYGQDFAAWNLNPATTPAATIANTALALTGFEADSYSDPRTKSYAAFGQADWHITDELTLTAGLRYTHENKKGSFSRFQLAGTGVNLATLTPDQVAAVTAIRNAAAYQLSNLSFSAALKDNAVSGLVTLGYKLTPDVLVYGSYSRGSKSGGLNITAGGASRPTVDPEKVDAFELGLKSQFLDRRLTFNAAAFLTEIRDYQANVSEQIPGSTASNQYIANIPKVRSKGIEADLSFAANEWLSFTASGAYTDARFVSYANAPQRPELAIPGTLQVQDLSGQRLPGVSRFAYSLGADVAQPVSDDFEVYGHADYLHRSTFNSTATNSIYGIVPAYGLLNGRIGLRSADGVYDFAFWVRNLTDKDYYVSRSPGTFGLISAAVGEPRTFGATFRVKL